MGRYVGLDDLLTLYGDELKRFFPDGAGGVDQKRLQVGLDRTEDYVDAYLHRFCGHGVQAPCPRRWPQPLIARAVIAIFRRDWHIYGASEAVNTAADRAVYWLRHASVPPVRVGRVRHSTRRNRSITEGF